MDTAGTSSELTAPLRVAIYLRYSANMSRPASLEDQERNCRKDAEAKGWVVLDDYVCGDAAKTGKTMHKREALEYLLKEAERKPRPFDVLMSDEQSRLARKLKDTLENADLLRHYGVKLYFVAQKLDSDDPNFQTLLTMHGMIDQQNSERMRHRVRRGQEGRVRAGYTSGSRCFGYRSVPVLNSERPDLQGRAAFLGHRWEIIESQAVTIRYIYSLYADGLSDYEICIKLNQENVPAARKPRIGPQHTVWNCSLIKRILQNDKYIGKRIWNKTSQVIHPVTGKTETRKNPPEQWVHTEVPDLRIVPDELWNRVQDRLKIVNEKMTRHRLGGINRAKKRDYLFSGLLYCGLCDAPITIGTSTKGGRSASYCCVSSRYKRGCTNRIWIREDRLAGQLVNALAKQLLVPEAMEYLVRAVAIELDNHVKGIAASGLTSIENLQAREMDLKSMISRLVTEMINPRSAGSIALPEKLAELETELKHVKSELRLMRAPTDLAEVNRDLETMVRASVSNLLEVIKHDVPKARQVLQRHIKKLVLVPTDTEHGPAYEVMGEIDLFKAPSDANQRILLDRSNTGTVQQYTGVIDFVYRFAGVVVDFKADAKPNPLLAPLSTLLRENPHLLHEPKLAGQWAELVNPYVPKSAGRSERIGAFCVSSHFRNRADLFIREFGLVEFTFGRSTYYMFSKDGAEDSSRRHAAAE